MAKLKRTKVAEAVEDAVGDQELDAEAAGSTLLPDEQALIEYFGDKEVRWYQVMIRNGVIAALKRNKKARILGVLPTGAGKTIAVAITLNAPEIKRILGIKKRKLRVLFIAHKHRLLTQAERVFAESEDIEIIYQSAFSGLPVGIEWDICVLDEAHHEAMTTIQYHLEMLGDKPILGLTATPDRADGCLIKFDVIINPISREDAVKEGYLAETNLNTFVDVPSKNKLPILTDIFQRYADQMGQTMVFVKTKVEVVALEGILRRMGYKAVAIIGQTERQLDELLDDFSAGKHQFLINCNKINEGVDVKGCTDVVLGRQFGSYPQLNQVIGRAARPDSDCNIWELINPLSGRNLDTTVIVGTPKQHRLISRRGNKWVEQEFDYTSTKRGATLADGVRIQSGRRGSPGHEMITY